MTRTLATITAATVLALGACGGSTPHTFADLVPAGAEHQIVDGHDLWIDTAGHTLYATDCPFVRSLTAEGGAYHASPSWATLCQESAR